MVRLHSLAPHVFVAAPSIALLLAIGCSSSSSPVDGPAPTTLDAACAENFEALVDFNTRCGIVNPEPVEKEREKARFLTRCETAAALPGSADSLASMHSCSSAYRSHPCDAPRKPIACESTPGTVPDGAVCGDGTQCASQRCVPTKAAETADGGAVSFTGCGTCVARAPDGAECDPDLTECSTQSYCDRTTKRCKAQRESASGGPCGTASAVCGAGLYCEDGTCKPRLNQGTACFDSVQCTVGFACVSGVCGPARGEGARCEQQLDCTIGLVCDRGGECVRPIFVGEGAECDGASLICNVGGCTAESAIATVGKCPRIIPDGSPCPTTPMEICDTHARCINGACSIPNASTCQ